MDDYDELSYGMPRDLNTSIKVYGVNMFHLLFVVLAPLGMALIVSKLKIFPEEQAIQHFIFVILSFVLCGFLILPFNSGQPHYKAFVIFITKRSHNYKSIDSVNLRDRNRKD